MAGLVASTLFAPQRIAVADLKAEGVQASAASMITSLLAEALARDPRFSVRDQQDLKALLVHDMEKQLVGCNDPNCYVDISKLVGADSIVSGKVGKVGQEVVLTVTRLDTEGTVLARASAKAPTIELLSREVLAIAPKLLADDKLSPPAQGGAGLPSFVVPLTNHDDFHWLAVRQSRLGSQEAQVYQATFPATHFQLGKYTPLDKALELSPHVFFLGAFHSCFPRQDDSLDAVNVDEKKPLAVKVGSAEAANLREAWTNRKLELTLRFEVVGSELVAARPYDWENCEDKSVKPFKASDITPRVKVRVLAATLRDKGEGQSFSLYHQKANGTLEPIDGIEP